MLRARACSSDRTVQDVARAVLTRALHFSPEDGHHEESTRCVPDGTGTKR